MGNDTAMVSRGAVNRSSSSSATTAESEMMDMSTFVLRCVATVHGRHSPISAMRAIASGLVGRNRVLAAANPVLSRSISRRCPGECKVPNQGVGNPGGPPDDADPSYHAGRLAASAFLNAGHRNPDIRSGIFTAPPDLPGRASGGYGVLNPPEPGSCRPPCPGGSRRCLVLSS
jgi:hypothetical protein